jgi:hypothetical protein
VLIANPDGWAKRTGSRNDSGGEPTRGYPPKDDAYRSATNPEAQYLWRWLKAQAPDLVMELRQTDSPTAAAVDANHLEDNSLAHQLGLVTGEPDLSIAALRLNTNVAGLSAGQARLKRLITSTDLGHSAVESPIWTVVENSSIHSGAGGCRADEIGGIDWR